MIKKNAKKVEMKMTDELVDFADEMLKEVKRSMRKTQTMFGELYKRLSVVARQPVADLFGRLERFLLSDTTDALTDASDVR